MKKIFAMLTCSLVLFGAHAQDYRVSMNIYDADDLAICTYDIIPSIHTDIAGLGVWASISLLTFGDVLDLKFQDFSDKAPFCSPIMSKIRELDEFGAELGVYFVWENTKFSFADGSEMTVKSRYGVTSQENDIFTISVGYGDEDFTAFFNKLRTTDVKACTVWTGKKVSAVGCDMALLRKMFEKTVKVEAEKTRFGSFMMENRAKSYTGQYRIIENRKVPWGVGELEEQYMTYKGDFVNGQKNGMGTLTISDGTVYTGDMLMDKATGVGKLQYTNGNVYEGGFQDFKLHGRGVLTLASGEKFEGEFKNGLLDGPVTYKSANDKVEQRIYEMGRQVK